MSSMKTIDLFSSGNMVIPLYLLKYYRKFNLKLDEFIFLMYLYNIGNKVIFNPNKYKEELGVELNDIMNYISVLSDKGFIKVDVIKNDKGLMEEVILLDDFFNKVSLFAIESDNDTKLNSNVYELIEKEFGRTLSPIEYEIISAWLENNFSEELIKEALKEATFNGVSNLKYIDKILYEWGKAGIKNSNDVEERRRNRKRKNDDSNIDLDIVDWNWFDDE